MLCTHMIRIDKQVLCLEVHIQIYNCYVKISNLDCMKL